MMDKLASMHLVNILGNMEETKPTEETEFSEMGLSALNEIGNIISGAYLSSLSSLTNLTITTSIPYMAIDMAGAILSVPAIEFGKIGDKALLIETEFGDKDNYVNGYFILIPTLKSYSSILKLIIGDTMNKTQKSAWLMLMCADLDLIGDPTCPVSV